MAENTKIEWCQHTFNPWWGCAKVHEGCTHCYAEAFSKRTGRAVWGPNGTRVMTSPSNWREPIKWNREAGAAGQRARVFCASMADVFEDTDIPVTTGGKDADELRACNSCGWIGFLPVILRQLAKRTNIYGCPQCDTDPDTRPATLADIRPQLFRLIDSTPWLDWLLLTKRPENIRRMWPLDDGEPTPIFPGAPGKLGEPTPCKVRRHRGNVWLGTSVSSQDSTDGIEPLLSCRDLAPVLFLSAEPLVGSLDLGLRNWPERRLVDWVIVGGESGPGARPCNVRDVRFIVEDCRAAGVACFVKQDSGPKPGMQGRIPDDIWVREFPREVAHA